MAKPKNLLHAFALRMFVVLLVNGVVWSVVVQYYYKQQVADQALVVVQDELQTLKPLISEVVGAEHSQREVFLSNIMQNKGIPFLEIYRSDKRLVFSRGVSLLPAKYAPFPDKLLNDSTLGHQLFKIDSEYFLYLYTPVFDSGWYMRSAIPVNPGIVRQIQDNTNTALLVVIVTLVQVAIILLPVMMASYRRILKDNERVLMSHLWTVQALGNAVSKRDSNTDSHNYRVSYYALRLAEAIRIDKECIPGLIKGAFLHDVGKIGVPDSILLKPARLSQEEFEIVQKHVSDGLDIVAGVPWLRDARPVISGHHERFDGSGYPKGLKQAAIPLEARIFAVVDVFDALTSRRPYKEPLTVDETLSIMDNLIEKHFDPDIYNIFRSMAPSLVKAVSNVDRHHLRHTLARAIQPYITLMNT